MQLSFNNFLSADLKTMFTSLVVRKPSTPLNPIINAVLYTRWRHLIGQSKEICSCERVAQRITVNKMKNGKVADENNKVLTSQSKEFSLVLFSLYCYNQLISLSKYFSVSSKPADVASLSQ